MIPASMRLPPTRSILRNVRGPDGSAQPVMSRDDDRPVKQTRPDTGTPSIL